MIRHYLFADRQTDSSTNKFISALQSLKHLKNAIQILFIEPDTNRKLVPQAGKAWLGT